MKKIFTMIILIISLITVTVVFAMQLSDITNHWGKKDIEFLIQTGAISGYPDGTFRPDNTITRAEFTKILTVCKGFVPDDSQPIHWAIPYIYEAYNKGYLAVGEFPNIDQEITRAEIARMVVRALGDFPYPADMKEYKGNMKDYQLIPDEMKEYVLKAYTAGIVTGYPDDTFRPNNTATRAEACTMLARLLDPERRIIPIKKGLLNNIYGDNFKIEDDRLYVCLPNDYTQYIDVAQYSNTLSAKEIADIARYVYDSIKGTGKYMLISFNPLPHGELSISIFPNKEQFTNEYLLVRANASIRICLNKDSKLSQMAGKYMAVDFYYITDQLDNSPKSNVNEYSSIVKGVMALYFGNNYSEEAGNVFAEWALIQAYNPKVYEILDPIKYGNLYLKKMFYANYNFSVTITEKADYMMNYRGE